MLGRFPVRRPRRLRQSAPLRRMVSETALEASDLIYPMFTVAGRGVREEVPSLPGVYRMSPDVLVEEAAACHRLGIPAVLLFGLPQGKDAEGSEAWDDEGAVQQAVRLVRERVPGLVVITDVCLCAYTDHGHCGVVVDQKVDNDRTLELLARVALSHARAGAHLVAPSDMMDGRVGAIRRALDGAGLTDVGILAYSAKYASSFYGPFREAADSAPSFGDRRSYQMDPANAREALVEVELDLEEGADMVMVKPALAYLDVIRLVRDRFPVPLVAYNVSGEYAMVRAAARNGWLDERRVVLEILTAIRRAGADLIITYHAPQVARWLAEDSRGC